MNTKDSSIADLPIASIKKCYRKKLYKLIKKNIGMT